MVGYFFLEPLMFPDSQTWFWKEDYIRRVQLEKGLSHSQAVDYASGAEHKPPVPGAEIEVDVVIIGAGYTGMSSARNFAKSFPMLRIALVEKFYSGFGASGRNTGSFKQN
jgi:hypothetical protein